MPQKSVAKPNGNAAAKVVVFGFGTGERPHRNAHQLGRDQAGHLVLFHEGLGDGWWEAIVVNRSGDKVTLRCWDYPGYSKFTMRIADIALMATPLPPDNSNG